MINYFATAPAREPQVIAGEPSAEDSGLVDNFGSDTFSFPVPDGTTFPYVTITDAQRGVIQFSILRR